MSDWSAASAPGRRPRGAEVDIWSIDLASPPVPVDDLWTVLSDDERDRAGRFHFERHRRRFTVRRGAMRMLLGAYLNREPSSLDFTKGPKGKPDIEPPVTPKTRLVFNLTDSADLALLAVGADQELGVDVECLERPRDAGRLVERYFSESERQVYSGLPETLKTDGFFRAWTSKEAYLKAIGTGLSVPLRYSTVELDPRRPPRIVSLGDETEAARGWSLYAMRPADGFVAALAIERRDNQLRTFRWQRPQEQGRFIAAVRDGIADSEAGRLIDNADLAEELGND
ncbi:MAG: 4'-phosphopantetheinyl transferase superfamily protein [Acidobacteriota bacterium]